MKLKQATTGAVMALACATAAHAQSAGTFYVTAGWFHFAPQSSSDPLQVTSPIHEPFPGSGASVNDADTFGMSLGYFITDHISAELEGGVPPKFDINGTGTLSSARHARQRAPLEPSPPLQVELPASGCQVPSVCRRGVTRVWFDRRRYYQ